jgi:hypothetical protein
MKNVAPIQLYQFDKINLSPLPLTITKVNGVIVKIVLSTTNPAYQVEKVGEGSAQSHNFYLGFVI